MGQLKLENKKKNEQFKKDESVVFIIAKPTLVTSQTVLEALAKLCK